MKKIKRSVLMHPEMDKAIKKIMEERPIEYRSYQAAIELLLYHGLNWYIEMSEPP